MGAYLVHHPLHNFSPEVGGGHLHGNGRLQGTLQYISGVHHFRLDFCECDRFNPAIEVVTFHLHRWLLF